jgi:hypothetical protein
MKQGNTGKNKSAYSCGTPLRQMYSDSSAEAVPNENHWSVANVQNR